MPIAIFGRDWGMSERKGVRSLMSSVGTVGLGVCGVMGLFSAMCGLFLEFVCVGPKLRCVGRGSVGGISCVGSASSYRGSPREGCDAVTSCVIDCAEGVGAKRWPICCRVQTRTNWRPASCQSERWRTEVLHTWISRTSTLTDSLR